MLPDGGSIADLFMALVAIPSPSGRERAVADAIAKWLSDRGVSARLDGTGDQNGSDAGNLVAVVPGAAAAPTLLFVAHMDTVETGAPPIRPRVDGGVIRSEGDTILGADNKAAVAAVMRACRAAARLPSATRPTVVGAFTCREESGRMGTSLLDVAALGIDCAFSVDGARPIGTVITRALGQASFAVVVHGRAAHAAADPEAGVNAIAVAGEIAAGLPLGRLPGGGSANVAAIIGGSVMSRMGADARAAMAASPTNSVPDLCMMRGEVRGYSVDEIEGTLVSVQETIAAVCERRGARFEWLRDPARTVPPMPERPDSLALALARRAIEEVPDVELVLEARQATLEANYLAAATDVVALASGGRRPHDLEESIPVAELERLEAVLTRIIELAAA